MNIKTIITISLLYFFSHGAAQAQEILLDDVATGSIISLENSLKFTEPRVNDYGGGVVVADGWQKDSGDHVQCKAYSPDYVDLPFTLRSGSRLKVVNITTNLKYNRYNYFIKTEIIIKNHVIRVPFECSSGGGNSYSPISVATFNKFSGGKVKISPKRAQKSDQSDQASTDSATAADK